MLDLSRSFEFASGPIFDVVLFVHPSTSLDCTFNDEALSRALNLLMFLVLRLECMEIEWIFLVSI